MEKVFRQDDKASIVQAEKETLALYMPIFDMYARRFKQYGVNLTTGIERESQIAYRAFIVCRVIDYDGNVIESNDHDMLMDFAWTLSSARDDCVFVFADVDNDVVPLLQSCEEYFRHPY